MSPLLYLLKRTLINTVKRIARKPFVLIGYIFMFLFIILIIVVTFIDSSHKASGNPDLFSAIIMAAFIIYAYFTLNIGIDKGSSFFRLSDVNLVFTGPFKSNDILIYGFIKQLAGIFFISLFALLQIPNLKRNFPISNEGVFIIMVGLCLYILTLPIVSMIIYSYSSKGPEKRKLCKRILNILVIIAAGAIVFKIIQTGDIIQGFISAMSGEAFSYIPIIGWSTSVISAAVYGVSSWFFIALILSVLSLGVLIIVLYNMEKDYYEDVLVATEFREKVLEAKKEGRGNVRIFNRKVKNIKTDFNMKGAAAIFQKNILEIKKTGFLLFDKVTLLVIAFALVSKFIFEHGNIVFALYFSVYILLLTTAQGRWSQELSRHYIFLIPANNMKKLFFATGAQNLKNLIDGFVLFIIAGFLYKETIPVIIICALTYTAFGAVYLYGDVVGRKAFGAVHSKVLKVFLKLFLMIFIVAPGIIGSIFIMTTTKSLFLTALCLFAWNVIASTALMVIGSTIFKSVEVD